MVAVGSYCAGAHIVHLDGSYAGTARAEHRQEKIAMPIELRHQQRHNSCRRGVRDEITLIVSGGIRSHGHAKAIAMGADGIVMGTRTGRAGLHPLRCCEAAGVRSRICTTTGAARTADR